MTQQSAPSAADVDAARLLLARLGVSAADLIAAADDHAPAPTFAEYIPIVRAAVTDGTRRVYGSYWNRIVEHWGTRRLDEPTPSEIQQLAEHIKTHVVTRRNARGGRSAAEHLIAAVRCVYRHAENDGHIPAADNPALKVTKPRRLPSTRRAVPDTRLAESITSPPRPATIQHSTHSFSDCTPKPRAVEAARSRSRPPTSTPTNASSDFTRKAKPSAGNLSPQP